MAKRAPTDEPEYNPLGISLVRDVIEARSDQPDNPPEVVPPDKPPKSPTRRRSLTKELHELPRDAKTVPINQEKLSFAPPLRVLLPVSEREELDELVVRLARELGTRVKLSHVLRSCLTLLRHSEEQLLKRARRSRGLVRPTNHEMIALAEFEDALTDLIDAAFHDRPLRRTGRDE
jgi:hypothetical protein